MPAHSNIMLGHNGDGYLDFSGLVDYSSLSKNTIRKHMRLHGLPYYAIDGKILFRRSEFDRWMQGFRKQDAHIRDLVRSVVSEVR
jgi:hypothetical protein